VKRIPWLSLLLLLSAYSTFSWFLYRSTVPWLVWVAVLTFALLQATLLTTCLGGVRRFLRRWLISDIGYFTVVLLGAFSLVVALVWFHIFGYIIMLIAAEVLARLDLQNAGFNRSQALAILTLVSVLGLAVGWTAIQLR